LAVLLAPTAVLADGAVQQTAGAGGYYLGFDEVRLRRDIADIRYYYTRPTSLSLNTDGLEDGFVYFGGDGFAGYRIPVTGIAPATGGSEIPSERSQDVGLWIDWRPDVTGDDYSADAAQMGRSLTGSDIERVGVRADVTALLFDDSGGGTTAWRVTGALGSTSLSLLSDDHLIVGGADNHRGLLWDVGVGWSSGAVSLNAGYQSATSLIEDGSDIAVLSLGADYAILPGLSVYGEFNVIDDPATMGDERLGTVFIVGTGLNF
jgi:hypothetical protein